MIASRLVWQITTSYTGSWSIVGGGSVTISSGNYIHVFLDDSLHTLEAHYRSAADPNTGSLLGVLLEGPNLFFGSGGNATIITTAPYFQYCDGTTLRQIIANNQWPYGNLSVTFNAAECQIAPTCDLQISAFGIYSTPASGPVTADGTITAFTSSSNGPVKKALNDPDFDYVSEGQTSSVFTGLLPGVYTVYAKDAIGCQDSKTVEVEVTIVYGVKYRLEFTDNFIQKWNRVDILERAYSGPVTEICSGGDPVHVKYQGDSNDPSKTIIPSLLRLQVKKFTAGQFADIFTDDDRRFKINHYVNTSNSFSVPVFWTGYIVPELYSEPWQFEPFDLAVTAVDNLGEFKNIEFTDEDGNILKGEQKAIKLVAAALKLTGISLPIRCGLNIFAEIMTQAGTDDPLDQAYIDTRIFLTTKDEPINCEDVIDKILAPFRANLCQSMGYWWIRRISDAVGTFDYRQFDVDGDFDTNSAFNPTQDLKFPSLTNRAAWANRAAFLSHHRNYGYFNITQNLGKDNNLIDEGRFEEEDLEVLSSGNQFFKNWNFFLGQAGVSFGFENVINGDSKGAFFADYLSVATAQADSKLYSIEIPMPELNNLDMGFYKIRFQYFISARYAEIPIRLGWSVKVTDGAQTTWMINNFPPHNSRGNNTDELINEIYVTSFNTWNTFELTASELKNFLAAGTMQVTFYMHNHYGRDFDDITDLKTFSISDLDDAIQVGRKVMVAEDDKLYLYTSQNDQQVESLPDVVRPNDYSNDFIWTLDKIYNISPNIGLVDKFLIDNVSISYYPRTTINGRTVNIDPPETLDHAQLVADFNKSNLEKTIYLGDLIRFNEGILAFDDETNERLMYRGWFRLEDGTPTRWWARSGVAESKRLAQITMEDYRDQFSVPKRKLSGTFISDIIWHFVNSVQEHFEGSRYQILTMDFDAKRAMYTIDMIQVLTGDGGEPPVLTGAYSSAYSHAFDHDHTDAIPVDEDIFDLTFDESFN